MSHVVSLGRATVQISPDVFRASPSQDRRQSRLLSPRHELARPWLKALRPMEVCGSFTSRTTTSVSVELRHPRLNACSLVLGDEQQFGVVGLCWRCGKISHLQGIGEVCVKTERCHVEVLEASSFEAEPLRVTALLAVPCSRMFGWQILKMRI